MNRIIFSSFLLLIMFSGCSSPQENLQNNGDLFPAAHAQELLVENFSAVDYQTFLQIKHQKNAVIIDIRTPPEIQTNALDERDMEMDYYAPGFLKALNSLDKQTPYLLYCRSGNRTRDTRNKMKEMGFREVYDLKGGITGL
jgi:rhodanese-related sulfurtransferase